MKVSKAEILDRLLQETGVKATREADLSARARVLFFSLFNI